MKNTEIAQAYLNAAYSGDIVKAKSLLADDITLVMGGNNELSGTYVGPEKFMEGFGKMLQITNNTYQMKEQIEWLEGEHRTILITEEQAEKKGELHIFKRVVDYQIEEGKIKAIQLYEGNPEITDNVFKS